MAEHLLTDEKTIYEVAKKSRSLIQKIKNFISELLEKITGKEDKAFLEKALKLYEKALGETGVNSTSTVVEISGNGETVSYSLSDEFSTQVDEALDDTKLFLNSHLNMGETPPILQRYGFRNLPILVTAKHTYTIAKKNGKYKGKNIHYHDLGQEIVKSLPEAISNPIIIMESAQNSKRTNTRSVVIVTKLKDKNGFPVIVAVLMDGRGRYNNLEIDANIMTSAYGKSTFKSFLSTARKEKRILYEDKKESHMLVKSLRV